MGKNSSSALWLRGQLSRAKGAAARRADQIAHIEVRIAFHRHHLQVHERDLDRAKQELAEFLESARDFEAAIELHESSASTGSAPTVGPHEAVTKYYGLGSKVLRELRAGPLAVRDLRAALAARLKVRPEDAGIFRHRLNVVLNNLLYRHVLLSSGDFWTQDRRWEINPDYRPKPREKRSKHSVTYANSSGRLLPALWLIRTQHELQDILAKYKEAGTPLPWKLVRRLNALLRIWREHPLHFEVACPPIRQLSYAQSISAQVIDKLERSRVWMTDVDLLLGPDPVTHKKRQVSLSAIRRALKRLLLEGRVQRRRVEPTGQVEWALPEVTY